MALGPQVVLPGLQPPLPKGTGGIVWSESVRATGSFPSAAHLPPSSPIPLFIPIPTASRWTWEFLGSEGSAIFPQRFWKHFSSRLEKKKKTKKNRLPDNVSLVGANVHFLKNVVLMPNPI